MAALNFGALFAYVTGSSLVLIGVLGVNKRTYGLLFACTSLGLMVGTLTNARLSRRGVSHQVLLVWGMTAITGTAAAMFALSMTGVASVFAIVPLAAVGFIGHGIVRPNVVQGALEPVPDVAGVASEILSAIQMATGAGIAVWSIVDAVRSAQGINRASGQTATLRIGPWVDSGVSTSALSVGSKRPVETVSPRFRVGLARIAW